MTRDSVSLWSAISFYDRNPSLARSRGKMLICWNAICHLTDCLSIQLETPVLVLPLPPPVLPLFFLFFFWAVFDLTLPTGSFPLMYPKWRAAFAIVSVEPRCGNRLAVCVLHIACSQRLRGSEQNNNHKFGLSAECQGCLVVGSLQHTRGTFAVIHWAEMLEIPNSKDKTRCLE